MAVTHRIEQGTLRIVQGCCPNLLHEASLYRYGDDKEEANPETPLDAHNHALAAVRYLICSLDRRYMARPAVRPDEE